MCRSLVGKRTCHFYNKWDRQFVQLWLKLIFKHIQYAETSTDMMREIYGASGEVLDIEDLVKIGKQNR